MATTARGDRFARVIGFLVFLLGVAIIIGVLWIAFDLWRNPTMGVSVPRTKGSTGPDLTDIGVGFGRLIAKIVLLFLGSICGSLIANKGIHLYFSGAPVVKE